VTSRVTASIKGGTANERQRLQKALDQIYNTETVTGRVDILATFQAGGKWRIEIAHMYGTGPLVRVEAPRGIPTDVRRKVMAELSAMGIPIDGA